MKYTIPGKENLNWLLDEIMQNGAWNYDRISFAEESFCSIIDFRLSKCCSVIILSFELCLNKPVVMSLLA